MRQKVGALMMALTMVFTLLLAPVSVSAAAAPTIRVSVPAKQVMVGNTLQLKTEVTGDDIPIVNYYSSNSSVASVDANGLITGVGTLGSASKQVRITAHLAGTGKSSSVVITVKQKASGKMELSKTRYSINTGKTFSLTAKGEANTVFSAITWTTSDPEVATVTKLSNTEVSVFGMKKGTAEITAECEGRSATCIVTVNETKPVITLAPKTIIVRKGKTAKAVATIKGNDRKSLDNTARVSWSAETMKQGGTIEIINSDSKVRSDRASASIKGTSVGRNGRAQLKCSVEYYGCIVEQTMIVTVK